jgi:hypothetical protein
MIPIMRRNEYRVEGETGGVTYVSAFGTLDAISRASLRPETTYLVEIEGRDASGRLIWTAVWR